MPRVGSLARDGCKRVARGALAAGILLGCGSTPAALSTASAYLDDASYRRAELEASIVNPHNGYSRVRLDHYDTGLIGRLEPSPRVEPRDGTGSRFRSGRPPTRCRTALSIRYRIGLTFVGRITR